MIDNNEIFDSRNLQLSVLVTPDMANFSGVMHGGDLLRILDQVAYSCASRYTGKNVVTLSVERVLFKHPIPIGNLLHFLANINYTGRTSCEVGIKVITENIQNRSVVHSNSSYFTMVAVDEHGRPTPIPPLNPQTEEEKRRFADGLRRKEAHAKN
ncbi:acyl-CoA thioesterase [Helicobacter sp. 11S02629-2]|uniref:acyl-CoA thioesterase n=1 Tax=Helicobacter sp. 11S02629-2 TaxID=1476195 RepID=UPI000BA562F8|nr:acyl-CoA thioesterase [Helicobacter sp. 11S02629-2]PAF44626.1 acyl-CoA thioesterase [Helicobacter sp. 11S02629-2]